MTRTLKDLRIKSGRVLNGKNPGDALPVVSKNYNDLLDYIEELENKTLVSQSKKYYILSSQSSTNAPTVESNGSGANTPFINTLGGSVALARTNTGRYTLNSSSLFGASASKCDISISLNAGSGYEFYAEWTDASTISISTFNSGSFSDDILTMSSIKIEVYP